MPIRTGEPTETVGVDVLSETASPSVEGPATSCVDVPDAARVTLSLGPMTPAFAEPNDAAAKARKRAELKYLFIFPLQCVFMLLSTGDKSTRPIQRKAGVVAHLMLD
jgi:hypothetical protein